MRPIDAEAVKDVIAELNENGYDISPSDLAFVRNILLRMPTVDAVPVVRCKECRFSVVNENIDRKPLICGKTKMCGETTPDWFCAAGKRSEE